LEFARIWVAKTGRDEDEEEEEEVDEEDCSIDFRIEGRFMNSCITVEEEAGSREDKTVLKSPYTAFNAVCFRRHPISPHPFLTPKLSRPGGGRAAARKIASIEKDDEEEEETAEIYEESSASRISMSPSPIQSKSWRRDDGSAWERGARVREEEEDDKEEEHEKDEEAESTREDEREMAEKEEREAETSEGT
jgi:hypothetical protein